MVENAQKKGLDSQGCNNHASIEQTKGQWRPASATTNGWAKIKGSNRSYFHKQEREGERESNGKKGTRGDDSIAVTMLPTTGASSRAADAARQVERPAFRRPRGESSVRFSTLLRENGGLSRAWEMTRVCGRAGCVNRCPIAGGHLGADGEGFWSIVTSWKQPCWKRPR